jgi:hypothetical protein
MDVESSIEAFGETAVWVECDLCGRAYGVRKFWRAGEGAPSAPSFSGE